LGYKGVPILAIHPPFNIVNGVVTDYLHCVLLGVTKSLIELWFGQPNRGKDFYIGNKVPFTSTGIAFATFIVIVLYHVYSQTKEFLHREDNLQPHVQGNDYDRLPVEDAGDRPLAAPSTTYVSYGSGQFREPLLNVQ